jgi:hypothetical protein
LSHAAGADPRDVLDLEGVLEMLRLFALQIAAVAGSLLCAGWSWGLG